jgi:hypothetical protein
MGLHINVRAMFKKHGKTQIQMRIKDGSEKATNRKCWKGYFTGFPNALTSEIIGKQISNVSFF